MAHKAVNYIMSTVFKTSIVSTISINASTKSSESVSKSTISSSTKTYMGYSSTKTSGLTTGIVVLPTVTSDSKSMSNTTIGIAIGIPVGIFLVLLLACLLYFFLKRDVALNSKITLSPLSRYSSRGRSSRLLTLCCASQDCDEYDLEQNGINEKKWPFGHSFSSRIRYEISNPIPKSHTAFINPHIKTPIKAATIEGNYSAENEKNAKKNNLRGLELHGKEDILASSEIMTPLLEDVMFGYNDIKPQIVEVPDTHQSGIKYWLSKSPLSKWVVNSAYGSMNEDMTAEKKLKKLKVLSKINKGFVEDNSDVIYDEKSTSIEDQTNSINFDLLAKSLAESSDSIEKSTEIRPHSIIYNESTQPHNNHETHNQKRKKRRESKFQRHLEYAAKSKPLPLTPTTNVPEMSDSIITGTICIVTKDYFPNLTDEIEIHKGDFIRILATHTDSWCLVEKSTREGIPIINENEKDISNKCYINTNRGIVPGDCLRHL